MTAYIEGRYGVEGSPQKQTLPLSSASNKHIPITIDGQGNIGYDWGKTTASQNTFAHAVNLTANTAPSSTTTGALKVTGGVGIGGAVWLGGHLNLDNAITTGLTPAISAGLLTKSIILYDSVGAAITVYGS